MTDDTTPREALAVHLARTQWDLVKTWAAWDGDKLPEPVLSADQAITAALDRAERLEAVRDAAAKVDAKTYSHIDGRDLFAGLHPRRWLDIVRRVDGRETRHEGDWLSDLYGAIKDLRVALKGERG